LKLLIASADRRPLELLCSVEEHFTDLECCRPTVRHWRSDVPFHGVAKNMSIAFEDTRPFTLHWGTDGWRQIQDHDSTPGQFGLWRVRIAAEQLEGIKQLDFTRRYGDGWEGIDYALQVR
jgi:glucoamylase